MENCPLPSSVKSKLSSINYKMHHDFMYNKKKKNLWWSLLRSLLKCSCIKLYYQRATTSVQGKKQLSAQKRKEKHFVFLHQMGWGDPPQRFKLQAGVQSELKLPVWSKNKQAKYLKQSQISRILRCPAETKVNSLQINQNSIQENSNLKCNLVLKITNEKNVHLRINLKIDLTATVFYLEMFQNYLRNLKKKFLLPSYTPEMLRQVGLTELWNLYCNKLLKGYVCQTLSDKTLACLCQLKTATVDNKEQQQDFKPERQVRKITLVLMDSVYRQIRRG